MPRARRVAGAVAVSSALYTVALSFPPAATLCVLLVPLPGLVLAARASSSECGLWVFLTASAVTVALGSDAVPGFLLPFGLPAVALAVGIRRFWPFEGTVLAGVAAWSLGMLSLSLIAWGDLATVVATAREQLTRSLDLALSAYGSIGAPDNAVAFVAAERDVLVTGLLEILPALVVLTGAVVVLANLILLRRWTDASGVNLRLWRTPDALIWGLIVTGFALFVPSSPLALVARNLFIIILGCYFCQGLAIVSYYLERFRLPRGIRVAGYLLIAVQHVVTAMVLALGVFDLWGNFRRLSTGPADISFHTDSE